MRLSGSKSELVDRLRAALFPDLQSSTPLTTPPSTNGSFVVPPAGPSHEPSTTVTMPASSSSLASRHNAPPLPAYHTQPPSLGVDPRVAGGTAIAAPSPYVQPHQYLHRTAAAAAANGSAATSTTSPLGKHPLTQPSFPASKRPSYVTQPSAHHTPLELWSNTLAQGCLTSRC